MNVNQIMDENNLDGILVTSLINIRYLSGFKGTEAIVLITKNSNYIFVDSRYYEIAKIACPDFEVLLIDRATINKSINALLAQENIKRLGFEADQLTVKKYVDYNKELSTHLVGLSLDKIRMIKTEQEIATIRKACEITDLAYSFILDTVKIGMSEKELNKELLKFVLDKGADGFSFETIIASGTRGSMPHGVASEKLIEAGDFITIDFGVFYDGYASDMTRTFVIGDNHSEEIEKVYYIVLEAQIKAINAIKPGVMACDIDKVARDYISEAGYGDFFTHGLGHSFGLEIHEAPYLSKVDCTELLPGMIVTVEPGIYLPGIGGVRIEDDILVTENGHEILNKSSKELIKLR